MKKIFAVNKINILLFLMFGIFITTGSTFFPHNSSVNSETLNASSPGGILPNVPAYFSSSTLWNQAIAYSPPGSILILNPSNGPGTSVNSNYLASVNKAKAAGIRILGYVYTGYGTRSIAAVQKDIDAYITMYGVSSIFFDEVSNTSAGLSYYQTLGNYVHKTAGAIVELNPGTTIDEGYMAFADIIVTYEDSYTNYSNATTSNWVFKYPSNRFAHIIYNVPNATTAVNTMTLAKQRNVGYIFVTNDGGSNPYDTLPSYWSDPLVLAQYSSGSSAPASASALMPAATAAPTLVSTATTAPTLASTPTAAPTLPSAATAAPTLASTPIAAPTLAPTETTIPTLAPTASAVPTTEPTNNP
jgi:hypothetical protein